MAALPIEGDREVTVVATALDDLRSRVAAFVERERSFTRDASHELRTPLTVIRSSTEQALRDPLLPPTIQPLLARSHRATERLEWTVSSLLALAREEVVPATDATTPVLPLLEELIVEAATALDTARLTTRVEVPSTCVLPASEPVLRIVLANVLGNACTHGAPGPLVIRAVDGGLDIENAVGPDAIPPAALLAQAGVRREQSPGYGLGLEISRRLCARAGLSLEVATTDHTFTVRVRPRAGTG
jgi:signal transduction histidine kinase